MISTDPRTRGRGGSIVGMAVSLAGVGAAIHSLRETAGHVGDSDYRELPAPQGKGHVTYHLSREAFTTGGALAAIAVTALGRGRGGGIAWSARALAAGGYLVGQWSGKATAGTFAPSGRALTWHVATTALLVGGTLLQIPGRGRG